MILTDRDRRLVFEIAMSHVLSRDQILELGLFSSVTRVNTRLRVLRELGLVRLLETPYFNGSLYVPGVNAPEVLSGRVAGLIANRQPSPRFLRHALCVTNIRLALQAKGATEWKFEPVLWRTFESGGRKLEVRPDGMAITRKGALLIECDLGHVSPQKLASKLLAYQEFQKGGHTRRLYGHDTFNLLIVTTGSLRASRLRELAPSGCSYGLVVQTFEELGASMVGGWG
jgi:hypothetical protein